MFNRSDTRRSHRFTLPALTLALCIVAAPRSQAHAQVFEDGCYQGAGPYTGDITGVSDGGIAYYGTYNETTGVSAIRITVYNNLSYEVAGQNALKFEMPFLEVDSDGRFSGSADATFRLTIDGTYANCGVTGTWRVDDPLDEEYEPLEGSFTMEAVGPTPDPAADLCAALGGGIVPSMMLMMVGVGWARPRR